LFREIGMNKDQRREKREGRETRRKKYKWKKKKRVRAGPCPE